MRVLVTGASGNAGRVLGWTPQHDFTEFLRDLKARDARGEDIAGLWAPGQISTG